jgi:hypothetical protein
VILRLACALAALFIFASPAAAQRWPDPDCFPDPNIPSCLQSRADGLARDYGVRRIEEHRDAGDEVVRIFYEHNSDLALIEFVRAPGRDPVANVYFPRSAVQQAATPMQAVIPQAVWSEAVERAAYADRSFVSVPPRESDGQTVCLHPWAYVFEASDPAAPEFGIRARIRRHSIDSCDAAPLLQFAADFRRLALPLFPACDALDPRAYGNEVLRLVICQVLSGDKLAAATVMNMAYTFQTARGPEDLRDLQELIDSNAVIDWNGRRRTAEDRNPAAFWLARVAEHQVVSFVVRRAEGLPGGHVRVTGYLLCSRPGTNDGTYLQAHFEQAWATTWSGTQVVSLTVGPWEQRPD